jgi:hypothetical protein
LVRSKGGARGQFDDSKWPLIIATAPPAFGPEAVAAIEHVFEGYFRRAERYALIFDTRPVTTLPDAKCRKALAAWLNTPSVRLGTSRLNVGAAIIVTSQLARYGITVVNWLYKAPTPQFPTATMGEAVTWCCKALERAHVPLGARLVEFRETQRVA